MITQEIMNRMVANIARNQNGVDKLNAGQIRESINLILNAFACEIMISTRALETYTEQESEMPAKKKGKPAKKMVAKPMPKKK